jgi:hypothetical protein
MASRRDIFDEELPFDELDPCCQKEIINNQKKKEVNSKLRNIDRSQKRLDLRKNVFQFYGGQCICCEIQPIDYEALRSFKQKMELSSSKQIGKDVDSEDDEDSDDDLLLDDIPLTEEEQSRLLFANKHQADLETAKGYGLGVYLEDSPNHLVDFAANPSVPLVLHIYQPSSELSAIIDYHIEKSFCELYLGTIFRRIPYSHGFLSNESIQEWQKHLSNANDLLICFKSNQILSCQSNLSEFGEHADDIFRNLKKFLEFSNVLEKELPHPSQLFPKGQSPEELQKQREEDEEEIARYCDDPDCIKRYPHEHIGKALNNLKSNQSTAPSFLASNRRIGEEALAPDLLRRL